MNDSQGKALCSLLTILVVLLFIMVLYRVYQSLEQFEESMQSNIKNVEETSELLNTRIGNFLASNDSSAQVEKINLELKNLKNKNKTETPVQNREDFVMEEEERFHGNMIQKLEPFTDVSEEELKTKIDRIQELLREIRSKSKLSLRSVGDVFQATTYVSSKLQKKEVNLLLQEYSIENNPTGLYIIPETIDNKYSLMCIKTLKNNKDNTLSLELANCKFFDEFDVMKSFLFKLSKIEGSNNKVNIIPYMDENSEYTLKAVPIDPNDEYNTEHKITISKDNEHNVFTISKV